MNATIQMVALATVDFELAMDTAVPKVTITSPTSRPSHTSYSSKFTIGGTASDDVGINQVAWSNDKGGSGICVGTSDWSTSEIQLSQGTNVITIFAQDTDENVGISTLTVTYVLRVIVPFDPGVLKPRLQPVVPTVAITSPVPDSTYTTYYSTLNISGTASDDKGISQVTWSNDRGGSDTCLTTKLATGDISIGWTASEIPLSLGINVITITAQDTNGNVASSTLTVDKQLLKLKDPIFTNPFESVLTKPTVRFP